MKKEKMSLASRIGIALIAGIAVGAIMWLTMGSDLANEVSTTYIKPFGDIFVNLLKFIVVPVVLLSLIDGMISMSDIKKAGSIGIKTVAYFLCTTALACVIGLVLASAFKPLFPVLAESGTDYTAPASTSIMDTIVGIFPSNFLSPLVSSNMLQIIVIAMFIGCGIIVAGEKGKMVADFTASANEVILKVMGFIIELAPIGVFCLMTWVVSNQGPQILGDLAIVLLCAYIGYFLHAFLIYSMAVKFINGLSPITFFKKIIPAYIFAFSSTSSVATLPVTKKCCDEMGVKDEVSAFVLPLGATINMDGTAIYQCVAAVFLAKCMGMDLSMTQMIMIVVTATLASIGTAGVSGAGMIMLAMVLEAIGINPLYIGIIYGIDRLFDMGRTAMNVVGDASCAICVGTWEAKKAAKLTAGKK
ncbi:MAG: dicarboxylate/amino acid:cation symporter [Eubacteriales bacterium]